MEKKQDIPFKEVFLTLTELGQKLLIAMTMAEKFRSDILW